MKIAFIAMEANKSSREAKTEGGCQALHKDDDTFDVMFTEPGFEENAGGNHMMVTL